MPVTKTINGELHFQATRQIPVAGKSEVIEVLVWVSYATGRYILNSEL